MNRELKAQLLSQDLRDRSFRGMDLRGLSFKGKDLSGSDFSGANLRGVNFTKATLRQTKFIAADIRGTNFSYSFLEEADFTKAKAGYKEAWVVFSGIVWVYIIVLCANDIFNLTLFLVGLGIICYLCSVVLFIAISIILTARSIIIEIPSVVFSSKSIRDIFQSAKRYFFSQKKELYSLFNKKFIVDVVFLGVFNSLFLGYSHEKKVEKLSINILRNIDGRKSYIFVFTIPLFCLSFSIFSIWTSLDSNNIFPRILILRNEEDGSLMIAVVSFLIILLTIGLYGGYISIYTTFKGSNLRKANFTGAYLARTRFEEACCYQTNWRDCFIQSDFYDFPSIFLDKNEVDVFNIAVTGEGKYGIFNNMDLRFTNLSSCNLSNASFVNANLHEADLQNADLSHSNLTHTTLSQANLRGANLTGACIQSWLIDLETKFDDVKCDFIYLSSDRTPESRRPLVGEFADGDFSAVYKTFGDTLDLLFHTGSDPVAFRVALAQLLQNNPKAEIKGLSKLSDKSLNVSIGGIPKAAELEVARTFKATESAVAEQRLQAAVHQISYLEGENHAQRRQIDDQKGQIDKLIERIGKMAEAPKYDLRNAYVGGIADTVQQNQLVTQNNQITEQNFDILFSEFKQFIDSLQTKYPKLNDEAAVTQIIDVEAKLIEAKDPKRWQSLLNLKRLWNGGKKATFKMGEHFVEQSVWGKGAIAFLEGLSEDVE
ncbi:hypothetical protein BV378_04020 [Nostoc sp. RF31YmG]|nr:hypothetical protein BV378_04020 [Nostoc sp. RF31YmG]